MGWLKRQAAKPATTLGRVLVAYWGLGMMGAFAKPGVTSYVIGVVGLVLAAGALGLIELGLALWYRSARRRSTRR
jgi:hypothetical protein